MEQFSPVLGPGLVVLLTLVLVVGRPRRLNEGWIALAGALTMLAFGWASDGDFIRAGLETVPILLFLLGMMVVAASADAAGAFEWAARHAIRLAGGSGRRLFVLLYLLGATVTLTLSLDVAAIILAPIICTALFRLEVNPRPYLIACAFVANTGSLALPMSNLTNMLVYELLGVDLMSFVRYLAVPHVVALVVNLVVLLALFRKEIPHRVQTPKHWHTPPDQGYFRCALAGLALLFVALLAFGLRGWPLWPPALAAALLLAGLGIVRGKLQLNAVFRRVNWSMSAFVIGLYVMVLGLQRAWGVIDLGWIRVGSLFDTLGLVLVVTAGVNVVNNIPMSLVVIGLLQQVDPSIRPLLSGAALIGSNIGPNLTPYGSLATMLVLGEARRRGVEISFGEILRTGLFATPFVIVAATATLVWSV